MDFFERVKLLVKTKNTTIKTLVEDLGLNYGSYNTLRKSNNLPRADEAVKIAQALNTTVEYLVTGEDSNPAEIELKELKEKLKNLL